MHENNTNGQVDESFQVARRDDAGRIRPGDGDLRRPGKHGRRRGPDDLGYTVALVGSNQLMLGLWVVGGSDRGLRRPDARRALGGPAAYGGRLRLSVRGLRAAGGIPLGLGLVPDRLLRPVRGVRVRVGQVSSGPVQLEGTQAVLLQRLLATLAILILAAIHVSGRERTARCRAGSPASSSLVLGLLVVAGLAVGWPHSANLNDAKPVDGGLAATMTVLARLYLLRLHRLEWRVLPRRRDPRSPRRSSRGRSCWAPRS